MSSLMRACLIYAPLFQVSMEMTSNPIDGLQLFDCSPPTQLDFDKEMNDGNERCAAWPATNVTIQQHPSEFFWIHYPKTGTSFANVVVRTFCKDIPNYAAIRTKIQPSQNAHLGQYFEDCFSQEMTKCAYFSDVELKRRAHLGSH
jgi:hypothetical protein